MKLTGVILAGGKAQRMNGANKALVSFHGKPMIAEVIKRFQPQVDEILINATSANEFSAFQLPIIMDEIGDFSGPLAGLHTGLHHAKNDWILCVPCDSPLLPYNLAEKLVLAIEENKAEIAVAKTRDEVNGEKIHAVFCLCKKSLLPDLEDYLKNGGRKVNEWQKQHRYVEVNFDDHVQAFANINTFEELAQLEAST